MKFLKPKKVITRENNTPYLVRWNLFECRFFSIKLHRIFRSDYECLHDHPWAFVSIILWGGYVEYKEVPEMLAGPILGDYCVKVIPKHVVSRIYRPGSILFRRAEAKHKLEIHQPCTTLVITFKKTRTWGFWTKEGFITWWNYDPQSKCE